MTPNPYSVPPKKKFTPESGLSLAFRLSTEFISGILVGLLMGYAIDQILGSQPWGLVIMVLLGASAGILNIFRILGLWKSPTKQKPPSTQEEKNKDG